LARRRQQLARIASAKGIPIPASPEGDKRGEVEQISALSGAELDRTVLAKLDQSHRASIKLFERAHAAAGDGGTQAANK